jgi:hypothetical protein
MQSKRGEEKGTHKGDRFVVRLFYIEPPFFAPNCFIFVFSRYPSAPIAPFVFESPTF